MRTKDSEILDRRQAELDARLDPKWQPDMPVPLLLGASVCYEVSDRVTAIKWGGIGVMSQLVRHLGLQDSIDQALHLLKRHRPYHESDHILNMAFNVLVGGHCLEDLELLRQNVGYMDALGAQRIPDPTTERDYLRRFDAEDVETLMDAINDVRRQVWQVRPAASRQLAWIDVDGTLAVTTGKCKQGAGFSYKGTWGYGPLVVSLANTQEVLYVVNRPPTSPPTPARSSGLTWVWRGQKRPDSSKRECGGTPTFP